MKKILAVMVGCVALCAAFGMACSATPADENFVPERPVGCADENFVPERPVGCALEYWLLDDLANADMSGNTFIPGWFGAEQYYGSGYEPVGYNEGMAIDPEYYVKYLLTAWPDYADGGQFVTAIDITDPAIEIYGISCQSDFGQFSSIMGGKGYNVEQVTDTLIKATRGKITFSLFKSGSYCELRIWAEVENRTGIIF